MSSRSTKHGMMPPWISCSLPRRSLGLHRYRMPISWNHECDHTISSGSCVCVRLRFHIRDATPASSPRCPDHDSTEQLIENVADVIFERWMTSRACCVQAKRVTSSCPNTGILTLSSVPILCQPKAKRHKKR